MKDIRQFLCVTGVMIFAALLGAAAISLWWGKISQSGLDFCGALVALSGALALRNSRAQCIGVRRRNPGGPFRRARLKIPANIAIREILAFICTDPNTKNWSDQAQQDLASTVYIAAVKAGHIGLWERGQ